MVFICIEEALESRGECSRQQADKWRGKVIFVCVHLQSLSGINNSFNLNPGQQIPWIKSSCSIKMHQWPPFYSLYSFIF